MFDKFLISLMCVNFSGSYMNACSNTIKAGIIESGIPVYTQKVEEIVRNQAENLMGKDVLVLAGLIHTFSQTGNLSYTFNGISFAESLTIKTGNKNMINIKWNF